MATNRNVDFITDLQERADHNINPHYWFNRVTPFAMARWRTEAYFAPLFFVFYSAMGVLLLTALDENAMQEHKTFWHFIFDFSNSFTTARVVGIFFLLLFWVVSAIATVQAIARWMYAPSSKIGPARKKEKKKKYPKRPKNYK